MGWFLSRWNISTWGCWWYKVCSLKSRGHKFLLASYHEMPDQGILVASSFLDSGKKPGYLWTEVIGGERTEALSTCTSATQRMPHVGSGCLSSLGIALRLFQAPLKGRNCENSLLLLWLPGGREWVLTYHVCSPLHLPEERPLFSLIQGQACPHMSLHLDPEVFLPSCLHYAHACYRRKSQKLLLSHYRAFTINAKHLGANIRKLYILQKENVRVLNTNMEWR